jgi:hypothetical protein
MLVALIMALLPYPIHGSICTTVILVVEGSDETVTCYKLTDRIKSGTVGSCAQVAARVIARKSPDGDDPVDPLDWVAAASIYGVCGNIQYQLMRKCESLMQEDYDGTMTPDKLCDMLVMSDEVMLAHVLRPEALAQARSALIAQGFFNTSAVTTVTSKSAAFLPKAINASRPAGIEGLVFGEQYVDAATLICLLVATTGFALWVLYSCAHQCFFPEQSGENTPYVPLSGSFFRAN